jgi:SNF2 family DNA or RNA helicase
VSFEFKTQPRDHQAAFFEKHQRDNHALFWDPGVGKTWPIINVTAKRFVDGEIDGLLVVAPLGVDHNWIRAELPKHCPVEYRAARYVSSKSGTNKQERELDGVLDHRGLSVLTMGYDAFKTEDGKKIAKAFLTKRKAAMALDESQMIKSPGSTRTKMLVPAGRYAKQRWCMSGTPAPQSPLDFYAQMKFVDEDFWKRRDIANFAVMRAMFEIVEMRGAPGRMFPVIQGYRNPELIGSWIKEMSSRLRKEDCLDLPPKIFATRFFKMTPRQRKAYDTLQETYELQIDSGEEYVALSPLVRLMRLHQIACGYLPHPDDPDDPERAVEIDPYEGNARLKALGEELDAIGPKKVIIWYAERQSGFLIQKMLGNACVKYDGTVGHADREAAVERWRNPLGPRYLIGNPAAGIGRGYTLVETCEVVYYSQSFKLEDRLQSEDRCHRIGQHWPVRYGDVAAEDSVDLRIAEVLRNKDDLERRVLGDPARAWI